MYNLEDYDHEYNFTEAEMQELHDKGELYVTQTDSDGVEMTIRFTYNNGKISQESNFKNLKKMNWYNIKNIAESNLAEVMIYDEIGMYGVDAKSFINEIKSIPKDKSVLLLSLIHI